jgi:S-adenosylmethionine decarboxylase proenzyme
MFLPIRNMYSFKGNHYLSSFLGCNESRLKDVQVLQEKLRLAITQCGATILQESVHVFSNDASTMVFLLSESHCSIHAYVEHGAVFMDLFTCGDSCDYVVFENYMKDYLQPKQIVKDVVERGEKHTFI